MTIQVPVTTESIKGGVAARASAVGLAGHARDEERAVASVVAVVGIWARYLRDDGALEGVLSAQGLSWNDGGAGIVVEAIVTPLTN